MSWDDEAQQDIAALPWRIRWRYRMRPARLRYLINTLWPGHWSAEEIAQIRRRARERYEALKDLIE